MGAAEGDQAPAAQDVVIGVPTLVQEIGAPTADIDALGAKGLGGARVDEIAERAGANKRMLYHYFGNKEDLFLAALESVYADIRRHELTLDLEHQEPLEAMRSLVIFTWDYFVANPHFITFLNSEN